MLSKFNLECRECRTQDCDIEIEELSNETYAKVRCNRCDNVEFA